jgi:hypothetical protein
MTVAVTAFDPRNFTVEKNTIYVFDFDGVVIDPVENDVYDLPEEAGEQELLSKARDAFCVKCGGMKAGYQRHLLYQAALLRNGRQSAPGPAFDAFKSALDAGPAFVLTARSGWDATERTRRFLEKLDARPVEVFHIGRVAKYLQLQQLLEEYRDRTLVYLDDSSKRIDEIRDHFDKTRPDETRLAILSVSRIALQKSAKELREHFAQEVKNAMSNNDELLAQWERFSKASGKEKQWMNERFNWLVLSQAFLFTMLTFAVNPQQGQPAQTKITGTIALPGGPKTLPVDLMLQPSQSAGHLAIDTQAVLLLAIGLGLLVSTLVAIGLIAAGRMHWVWTSELNRLALRLRQRSGGSEPFVPFGTPPHWPARTSSMIAPTLALSFTVIWGILLYFTWDQLPPGGPALVVGGVIAVVALLVIILLFDGIFSRER